MNRSELLEIIELQLDAILEDSELDRIVNSIYDLEKNRTLLVAYNQDQSETVHVYLDNGKLYAVYHKPYAGLRTYVSGDNLRLNDLFLPRDFTVITSATDAQFAALLVARGAIFTFSAVDDTLNSIDREANRPYFLPIVYSNRID